MAKAGTSLRRLKQTHTAKPKLTDCVCAALGPGFHRVQFHKDPENKFACPVLGKVFTDSTHIVANKKSGNVYCMQAIEELNIKAKNWKVPRGPNLRPNWTIELRKWAWISGVSC